MDIRDYGKRWMFRLIDILFSCGSVAVLTIMSNDYNQRIGDIVGDTANIAGVPGCGAAPGQPSGTATLRGPCIPPNSITHVLGGQHLTASGEPTLSIVVGPVHRGRGDGMQ